MKTPFTAEQFFNVFKEYNLAVFPMQIIFYLLGILVIYFAFVPTSKSDKIINLILAFFWLWMGIVYHLIFFTMINKLAYFFGIVFIIQGILFLVLGVFQDKLSFKFRPDKFGIAGMIFIVFALLVYPVLGYMLGHVFPSSPGFGLPCPTTIFTLGILLLSSKKFSILIFVLPFAWSIVGLSAVNNFGVIEDLGLTISGVIALTLWIYKQKQLSNKETWHST